MMLSGKWALKWHDQLWGPFESEDHAKRVASQIRTRPNAPQDITLIPLLQPGFVFDLIKEWD